MYPKPPQAVCAAWAKIAEAGEGGQIYCMMLATEYEGDKLTATSSRVILVRANDIQAGRVMFEPVTDGEKEAVALMSIPTTFTDKKTDADADKIIEENGDQ